MSVDGLLLLERATVAVTLALLIVLGLRTVLRRHFGAAYAYASWLLVLLMPCACLVPNRIPTLSVQVIQMEPVIAAASHLMRTSKSFDYATAIVEIWLAGAICFGLFQCWLQWRFVSGLGKLERIGTMYRAQTSDIGPALVGLLRAKIVVPFDFTTRYTTTEQDLILAHECAHVQRGDFIANGFCALLQTVFWFHPLMHVGAMRFRDDQELACDATVMRVHAKLRKTYAQAMLKTHVLDFALPAGCGWQSKHLLKERIMQLNRRTPSSTVRQIGGAVVTTMICLIVCGVWAAQAPQAADADAKPVYDVSMTMKFNDGNPHDIKIKTHDGEQFVIKQGEGDDQWQESFVLHAKADNTFSLESKIEHKNQPVGHPSMLFHSGQPATIRINAEQVKYELVVDAHSADAASDSKAAVKSGS